MAKKLLQIIEVGYRATIEEQDDTVVWLTHAMRGAGEEADVLLRGNAVCYAVRGQDSSGLAFGQRRQTHPPRLADDLSKLIEKGAGVYIVKDDLAERGIESSDLIEGIQPVPKGGLAKLLDAYERVWHW